MTCMSCRSYYVTWRSVKQVIARADERGHTMRWVDEHTAPWLQRSSDRVTWLPAPFSSGGVSSHAMVTSSPGSYSAPVKPNEGSCPALTRWMSCRVRLPASYPTEMFGTQPGRGYDER
jgi:hypothetical protein